MEELLRKSQKVTQALQSFEILLGVFSLFVLFTIIMVNVVTRYIFFKPIAWSDELCNYLFIWMSFLASAYVMAEDGHVRVTAVESRLPEKVRNFVRLSMNVIMLFMFALYVWPSFRMLGKLKKSNMLEVPLKFVYVIMPICFLLMCVHIVNNILRDVIRIKTFPAGSVTGGGNSQTKDSV